MTGFVVQTANDHGFGVCGVLAVIAFLVTACCCIWVLLPRWKSWEFTIDARSLIPFYLDDDEPETPEALYKYLANALQDDVEHNAEKLDGLFTWFTWAACALSVEVFLWRLALALD